MSSSTQIVPPLQTQPCPYRHEVDESSLAHPWMTLIRHRPDRDSIFEELMSMWLNQSVHLQVCMLVNTL